MELLEGTSMEDGVTGRNNQGIYGITGWKNHGIDRVTGRNNQGID